MDDQHLVEYRLASEELCRGSFLRALRDTVRLPDGGTSVREFVLHPGAVVLIALLPDNGGMKVLDLQCSGQHAFEGWFASEDDFVAQQLRGLVECPFCGDAQVSKKLSAPRLNLGSGQPDAQPATQDVVLAAAADTAALSAWMAVARQILARTEDVGEQFAEEARRIHYGESPERGIRGQASRAETESLLDEGIAVLPLPLPVALKGRIQ